MMMANEAPAGIVTGDWGLERYIYIEALPDEEAHLREAWVNAQEFATVWVEGGAAQLAKCLGWECRSQQVQRDHEAPLESIYLLTKASHQGRAPWQVARAIVAGERQVAFEKLQPVDLDSEDQPIVVVDFHQGWLESNADTLEELLAGRRYLIRTHDPVSTLGVGDGIQEDFWSQIRALEGPPGIWFSPYQDMADGGLRIAGEWVSVCDNIIRHLKDGTRGDLWDDDQGWLHHVVIQVSYDGALVLSPGEAGGEPNETILAFPSDQPGSFDKCGYGTVVGGGICIVASLAQLLVDKQVSHGSLVEATTQGLARARRLVMLGYTDPPVSQGTVPDPPEDWNAYPKEALSFVPEEELPFEYELHTECHNRDECLDRAVKVVTADDHTFRRMMAYRLGRLYTCSPEFAGQLVRLEERIESHVKAGEEAVLSVAVLGGPGSGKSFAAEQVLDCVGEPLEAITFNVSQFATDELLADALREVQTLSLQGKVPFVFWDEFDCVYDGEFGGWLKKFLMPMQDAKFWDGNSIARLGKCVFIFVGSTWSNKAEFEAWVNEPDTSHLKGRDFHSRLDRILEVPAIELSEQWEAGDACAMLTRALVIRLCLLDTGLLSVDRNVLDFLLTGTVKHGMRSLKAVIEASQLGRTERFCDYHLPPPEVLEVHFGDDRPLPRDRTPVPLQWA